MRYCWLPLSHATLLVAQLSQRWGSLMSASCVPASPSSRYQPSCSPVSQCRPAVRWLARPIRRHPSVSVV